MIHFFTASLHHCCSDILLHCITAAQSSSHFFKIYCFTLHSSMFHCFTFFLYYCFTCSLLYYCALYCFSVLLLHCFSDSCFTDLVIHFTFFPCFPVILVLLCFTASGSNSFTVSLLQCLTSSLHYCCTAFLLHCFSANCFIELPLPDKFTASFNTLLC